MCLLLGPPGSGKSTLLKALAGKIQTSNLLKVSHFLIAVLMLANNVPSIVHALQQLNCHGGMMTCFDVCCTGDQSCLLTKTCNDLLLLLLALTRQDT